MDQSATYHFFSDDLKEFHAFVLKQKHESQYKYLKLQINQDKYEQQSEGAIFEKVLFKTASNQSLPCFNLDDIENVKSVLKWGFSLLKQEVSRTNNKQADFNREKLIKVDKWFQETERKLLGSFTRILQELDEKIKEIYLEAHKYWKEHCRSGGDCSLQCKPWILVDARGCGVEGLMADLSKFQGYYLRLNENEYDQPKMDYPLMEMARNNMQNDWAYKRIADFRKAIKSYYEKRHFLRMQIDIFDKTRRNWDKLKYPISLIKHTAPLNSPIKGDREKILVAYYNQFYFVYNLSKAYGETMGHLGKLREPITKEPALNSFKSWTNRVNATLSEK